MPRIILTESLGDAAEKAKVNRVHFVRRVAPPSRRRNAGRMPALLFD